MDQEKIGKFISKCRKDKNLTQEQLAYKLGISDRAVSKWERGLNLPDASLMLELCNILDINVNELLTGGIIEKKNYIEKAEGNLIKMKELEEKNNKKFLIIETFIGLICSIPFIALAFVVEYTNMDFIPQIILITILGLIFILGLVFAMNIERKTGYYECNKCHHKHIPRILPFWFSMHYGRTRYLKCPKCKKRSWNKKVLTK